MSASPSRGIAKRGGREARQGLNGAPEALEHPLCCGSERQPRPLDANNGRGGQSLAYGNHLKGVFGEVEIIPLHGQQGNQVGAGEGHHQAERRVGLKHQLGCGQAVLSKEIDQVVFRIETHRGAGPLRVFEFSDAFGETQGVIFTGHHRARVFGEFGADESAFNRFFRRRTQIKVNAAVSEPWLNGRVEAFYDFELDVGKLFSETWQGLGQQAHVGHDGQAHDHGTSHLPRVLLNFFPRMPEFVKNQTCPLIKEFARRGENHSPGFTLK